MILTQMGNKLLSGINIFQDLLQKFIGKPLLHGGGIQLHILHTSGLEMSKPQEVTEINNYVTLVHQQTYLCQLNFPNVNGCFGSVT